MTNNTPATIEYRNGIYQGSKQESQPSQIGLFFDDNFTLHCSSWKQSKYNGPTAILISHGKYMYGDWKEGVPHGFNVFRGGEIVVLGNFKEGRTDGMFAVVFERHKFVVVGYPKEDGFAVEWKREYEGEEELKKIIMSSVENFGENYYSFVRYLGEKFCQGEGDGLELKYEGGKYWFGYVEGIGAVIDDFNQIERMGEMMERSGNINRLGVCWGSDLVSAGNFENEIVIKYQENMKPTRDIKKLFRIEHKRSVNFKNDYFLTKQGEVTESIERIIKMTVDAVMENPIETKRHLSRQQLNDSLEYINRSKTGDEVNQNERLKMIRSELHRSIGVPNGIKPSQEQMRYMSRYPSEMRHLYYKPFENALDNESSPPLELRKQNRLKFLEQNHFEDYRIKQIHLPLTTKKMYENQVPELIEDHVNYQIHRSRQSRQSRQSKHHQSRNSPKIKRREGSFSPSPIYSAKQTERNSPNKSMKEFQDISIVRKSGNQLDANDSFNPKQYHTNRKVEELIEQIVQSNTKVQGQSPYKRHALDSNRESNARADLSILPTNFSRGYIPVSHQNKQKSPSSTQQKTKQKQVQPQTKLVTPPKPALKDRAARSYLEMFRTAGSPNKQPTQIETPKAKVEKSTTPQKKSIQRKQNDKPSAKVQNINHLYFRKKEQNVESLDHKNKLIEQITRKYNRANNH